jgi:hypothetical protein
MLSAGKPLQWLTAQLGRQEVAKIDETYGGWRHAHELSARLLDLGDSSEPGICPRFRLKRDRTRQEFLAGVADS